MQQIFAAYHYAVKLSIGKASDTRTWRGDVIINIHGSNGQLGHTKLNDR